MRRKGAPHQGRLAERARRPRPEPRYLALTLNHGGTVSFLVPGAGFAGGRLESLVTLPGRGADWALTPDRERLFVSIPEQSSIAVVNTLTRGLETTIPLGAGERPLRVALSPDGRRLWVSLDKSSLVAVIDTEARRLHSTIGVGRGPHNFAFTPDGALAFVSNSASNSVTVLHTKSLGKAADINVGRAPGPFAYGRGGGRVYVANVNDDGVSVIDPARPSVVANVPAGRGVVALRFEPRGRYAFAVSQVEGKVTVIDSATNKVVGNTTVVPSPDQIVFTAEHAYVRGVGSEKFSLIGLKDVAAGRVSAVEITAGQRPPSAAPEDLGVADMIAATPEGNSALVASAPDGMLYYYVEAMSAPMGTVPNHGRRPLALMVLDRSLAETAPGVYSTQVKLLKAGRYGVSLLIDRPRVVHCFDIELADSPDAPKQASPSLNIEPEFKEVKAAPNRPVNLRFRLKDAATGAAVTGLGDVQVLVFEPPGIWQQRHSAKEVGGGVYEVAQTFPRAGRYMVFVRVASRGVE